MGSVTSSQTLIFPDAEVPGVQKRLMPLRHFGLVLLGLE